MFSVIFEVQPKSDQWDAYLGYAKMLRPELEQIEGFVDNIRYRSLTRGGESTPMENIGSHVTRRVAYDPAKNQIRPREFRLSIHDLELNWHSDSSTSPYRVLSNVRLFRFRAGRES
jgi:hypothetical protein